MILKSCNKLSYAIYNVTSGRFEQDNVFPLEMNTFFGMNPQNISIYSVGDVSARNSIYW